MFWCVLERERRLCLNESPIFLSSKVIRERRYISKLLSFSLWPDLEGSRYDLKRWTRVPLDSERPKDSFSLYPKYLSQLGAKWHGGLAWQPPMCVLGWGNNMCGRGLRRHIFHFCFMFYEIVLQFYKILSCHHLPSFIVLIMAQNGVLPSLATISYLCRGHGKKWSIAVSLRKCTVQAISGRSCHDRYYLVICNIASVLRAVSWLITYVQPYHTSLTRKSVLLALRLPRLQLPRRVCHFIFYSRLTLHHVMPVAAGLSRFYSFIMFSTNVHPLMHEYTLHKCVR